MKFERLSMARLDEIQRLIREDLSDRQIARILHCRRTTVRKIREQELKQDKLKEIHMRSGHLPPVWTLKVHWNAVEAEFKRGYENVRIWEEYARDLTSHSNFYKYTRKRFALLLQKTVTLREFKPGEYAEVDYAGD